MAERYLPLYRKYRPQAFSDLIGQENIVKALSNAINLNKISHAYLLCGPRGTGKTTTARIIAKSLNCANGPTLEPCGECPSCSDIINSTPIDVIEIDAASNRKVEDARNILEKIQFVPVNGRFKIYIIDEVHMLTTEAFNTLLKTLEEPPENVIFILATTEPHKVLDTIISRCQRFDFRRITTDDIVARLKYISLQENINISEDALYTIARSSAGGMRDSLALLDQISVLDADKEISSDDVNDMLGRLSFEALFELTSSILDSNTQEAIVLIDKIYAKGNEPFQIITNLIQYFRNLLVVKNCTDRKIACELTQLSEPHVLKLKEKSEKVEPEQILYIIERLSFYSKEIKETTNRYLWLELCVIELASNVKFSAYSQLLERIERIESGCVSQDKMTTFVTPLNHKPLSTTPVVTQEHVKATAIDSLSSNEMPATATNIQVEPLKSNIVEKKEDNGSLNVEKIDEAKPNNITGSDLATIWQGILQNINSLPSRMFFSNLSKPIELTSEGIKIGFVNEVFVKQAQETSKNAPLKNAAMSYFGVSDINVHIVLADENTILQVSKPVIEKLEKKVVAEVEPQVIESEEESVQLIKSSMTEDSDESMVYNSTNDYNDLSDQSRMVMELFNGKHIE